jgi:hypothetical protein
MLLTFLPVNYISRQACLALPLFTSSDLTPQPNPILSQKTKGDYNKSAALATTKTSPQEKILLLF